MTGQTLQGRAQTEGIALADILRETDESLRSGAALSPPLSLGLTVIDAHIGAGLVPGDLAVIAGAQGVGKTTFALQIARNVALGGAPVTYICYEHDVQQILERLVVMEANLGGASPAPTLADVRRRLSLAGVGGLVERLTDVPGAREAIERVAGYGELLHVVSARGDVTGVADLRVASAWHDRPGLVVVDYLQKVHADLSDEDARVAHVATALKDFALEAGQSVLAVSALELAGLEAKRIRARHLKGSVTLAYEADIVMVLQHKYDVVARDKLVYNLARAEDMHNWLVLSLEKNRHGDDRLDLAFRKRLARGHIDPDGHIETDPLVDERLHIDH